MNFWKSALFTGALLCVNSAYSAGYVQAYPSGDANNGQSLVIENNTPISKSIPAVRYYTSGSYTWYNPFTTTESQSHAGKNYTIANRAFNNGGGWIFAGNSSETTAPAWGSNGQLEEMTPLIKAGGCADPADPVDADPINVNDIATITSDPNYYNPDYRYIDTLGSNGGEYSARWVDTYYGQTQVQIALGGTVPTAGWNGALIQTDEPMIHMGLSAGQELFSMDKQYLLAIGGKETGIGTSNTPNMTNLEGAFGPFEIEDWTAVSRFETYPKFYPKYRDCFATVAPGDWAGLEACLGDPVLTVLGEIFGPSETTTNSAGLVNGVIMSGLLVYQYYDVIGAATDYCGRKAFSSASADPYLGLCAIAGHYNLGINSGTPSALKNASTIDAANGCDLVPQGNSNYVGAVRSIIEAITKDQKDSQTDLSIPLVDHNITWNHVQTFFWGDGGTVDAPGNNGLMFHFELSPTQKTKFWNDITNAYNQLAAHWGGGHISYRYDWITLLRVAKGYFDLDRPQPTGYEASNYIGKHSNEGQECDNSITQDTKWPFLNANGQLNGDFTVSGLFTDYETGPLYVEYSLESTGSWSTANTVSQIAENTDFEFTIDQSQIAPEGDNVWIRAADSCKNEVAMKMEIAGVKLSYLDSAWATDDDGDGYADLVLFSGRDHEDYGKSGEEAVEAFSDFASSDYKWPDVNSAYSILRNDSKLTNSGNVFTITEPDLSGSKSAGAELMLTWTSGSRSTPILDRVGPAILSASIHERINATQDDTLFVTFTEPINDISSLSNPNFLNVDDVAQSQISVFHISGSTWGIIFSAGIVEEGKFVNLISNSGLTDQVGNPPHTNNIKREIILNKGPVPLEETGHGFYDTNLDGKMDRVELKFKIPITQPQLDAMKFTINWLKESSSKTLTTMSMDGAGTWKLDAGDPTIISYDIPVTESIKEDFTWIDSSVAGMGEVTVSQIALDPTDGYTTFTPVVPDKMGPIIKESGAILLKTSRPDVKSDLLRVTFTEPIVDEILANNFLYKISSQERSFENSLDGHRLSANGTSLVVEFSPDQGDNRPNIGDSVKIETSSEFAKVIQDRAGNQANPFNPLRLIDGKVIVIFYSPNIAKYNVEKLGQPQHPWGLTDESGVNTQAIFFPGDTPDEEIYSKYGMGFGFSTSFANKNYDRATVKFNVEGNIYSNLGGFVINLKDEFTCEDVQNSPEMQGELGANACIDDGSIQAFASSVEFKVFYPWNMTSSQDRLVGSGAYFINLNVNGTATGEQGETVNVIDEGVLEKTFGVIRTHDESPKFQTLDPNVTYIEP